MSRPVTELPRRHRLTREAYHRMGEAGILAVNARVELIEGEIIDTTPTGSRHAGTVDQIARMLQRAAGDAAIVRVQNPIALGTHSEPEPDIALLDPRADFYKTAHPGPEHVLLIIEVADASLRYDLEFKAPLYARHGIAELWVVDLERQRLLRHRAPSVSGYGLIEEPDLDAVLAVAAAPQISLDLALVFSG